VDADVAPERIWFGFGLLYGMASTLPHWVFYHLPYLPFTLH
jgi:hypothetical protein